MLAYPLTEKRLREMVKEIAERRALTPGSPRAQGGS
jgi:hypothetical protein